MNHESGLRVGGVESGGLGLLTRVEVAKGDPMPAQRAVLSFRCQGADLMCPLPSPLAL